MVLLYLKTVLEINIAALCVCVCERERERERDEFNELISKSRFILLAINVFLLRFSGVPINRFFSVGECSFVIFSSPSP